MAALLEIRNLHVKYGETEVLHGIDLSVAEGGITTLVGANGAGKSTTLAAICGLVSASAGSVHFRGEPVNGSAPEKLARQGMALVPEGRRIFGQLTVAENLWLGAAAHARPDRESREAALLDKFPILRSRYKQKAGSLSGGEQQMLAIARALISNPRLLMLDEPSLGLAPQVIDRVFDFIAELKQSGLTILLVEQNVALALEVADHATVLANGTVVLRGTAQELARSDLVRQAYLGV